MSKIISFLIICLLSAKSINAQKYDTIKIIMQITDTCHCYHGQHTDDLDVALRWEGFTYAAHGYYLLLRNKTHILINGICPFPDGYLDENKNPLPKNFVVWTCQRL